MNIKKIIELFVYRLLNPLFPKRKRKFRDTPESYANKQYEWGKVSLSYFNGFIDFKGKKVLDAGCSLGGKTLLFSELGPEQIIGIDIDMVRLKYARENAVKKDRDIKFIESSLDNIPFITGSLDMIMLNDVVEHIESSILKNSLMECKRVLKKGGKLFLEFPPWQSHDASHLYDYINIPWCQLIFRDITLFQLIKDNEDLKTLGSLNVIEHYRELNRITIAEFNKIISELNFGTELFKTRMIKNLNFLNYIPFLNKYFVTRAIYILVKN